MAWVPAGAFEGDTTEMFTRVEMSNFMSGRVVEDQLEELLQDDDGVQVR